MAGFHEATIRDLRHNGVPAEIPDPGVLILQGAARPTLLLATLPSFGSQLDGAVAFEEGGRHDRDGFLLLGPREQVLIFGRRAWKRLEGTVDPDDPDAIEAIWAGRGVRRTASHTACRRLLVLTLPDSGEAPAALWLSVADGEAVRPVGFIGGESQAHVLESDFRDDKGLPVAGRLVLSAQDIHEGGRPSWSVLVEVGR